MHAAPLILSGWRGRGVCGRDAMAMVGCAGRRDVTALESGVPFGGLAPRLDLSMRCTEQWLRAAPACRVLSARGRRKRGRDGQRPDFEGELGGVQASARGGERVRAKLEVPVMRPDTQHADDVAQVGFRLEPVELAGGDEGEERRCCLRVVVAADEEPRLSADRDSAQLALARRPRQRAVWRAGTGVSGAGRPRARRPCRRRSE